MRHLTCDPKTEVIGQTVLSFIDNVQADEIRPYLAKHGLADIKPDVWYPCHLWLDVMNDLAKETNLSSNLVAIGMGVVDKMLVPPEMEKLTVGDILMGWNDLYHLQHRNGEIGYVKTEKVSDTHYKTIHLHLYPDDFTYGIAYGMAKRWLPKGTRFTVKYDPDVPALDKGGNLTIIHVSW